MKKTILIFLSAILAISLFVSCNGDPGTNVETKIVITFDKNGGTGVMAALSAKKGENVKLTANTFTWAEHAFKGWNTKADGSGFFYANEATDKFDSDTTLYAQWVEIKTITFNANDGSVMPATKTQVVEKGVETALEANTFTYSGFAFTKWNTESDGSGKDYANGESVALDDNLELFAIWAANTNTPYKVNHYIKNLTGNEYTLSSTDSKTDTTGVLLTLANLTKSIEGFIYNEGFAGTVTKGTTKPTSGAVTTATVLGEGNLVIDLYYSRDTHTVTLTNGTGVSSTSGADTYAYGETVNLDATLQTGYKFDNWTVTSTSAVVSTTKAYSFTMGTEDLSYTANASYVTFTVAFDSNGGSGSMDSQNFTYGTAQNLRNNTFTRSEYHFNGWNTSSDGKGTSYLDGQDGSTISTTDGATVTLYAQWLKPTISFNSNGGSGTMASQSIPYNTATNLNPNTFIAPEAKIFYGWNTKADGSGQAYSDQQSVTLTSNLELYAQWAIDLKTTTLSQTAWGGTNGNVYSMSASTDISDRITVTGSVTLLLPDGMTLNAQKGITVTGTNSLTIEGSGDLTATGTYKSAGIGGENVDGKKDAGIITIKGGTITATGGDNGAGIGSAQNGTGGTITIKGGTVIANGKSGGAGIGGGDHGDGGKITITGGTVTANSSGNGGGAGIGGGYAKNGGEIEINGGTVNATGGGNSLYPMGGAGIGGGGYNGAGGKVTITGGTVTAIGKYGGAGIGGGSDDKTGGAGADVTIKGGTVTAKGGKYNDNIIGKGIGAGAKSTTNGSLSVSNVTLKYSTNDSTYTSYEGTDYSTRYQYMKAE